MKSDQQNRRSEKGIKKSRQTQRVIMRLKEHWRGRGELEGLKIGGLAKSKFADTYNTRCGELMLLSA